MKKNFIIVITLVVLVGLSGFGILDMPQSENTTNNSSSSKEKTDFKLDEELTEDSAKKLIDLHDGEYISNWPKEWGTLSISESAKVTTIKEAIDDSYDIKDEKCFEYIATIKDDNNQEIGFWKYLIGAQTRKLYAISGQAEMEAYEIKDNKKVETYRYLKGESKEWHLLDNDNNVTYENVTELNLQSNKINSKVDNSENDENETSSLELKTMTAKEAKDLLLKHEGNYLNKIIEKFNNEVKVNDGRFTTINDVISTSWNIKNEPCYIFNLLEGENEVAIYLVGVNSGNVYAIPNQGGMSAYEIKDNKIVETYKWPIGDSLEWHDDVIEIETNNELTKEDAKELIFLEDRNYIEKTISDGFNLVIMSPISSNVKEAVNDVVEIENEPCYVFSVLDASSSDGEVVEYCRYIVCINSKNVYITNNQGGTSIYQVKNNEVIKKYDNNGDFVDWRK